MSVRPFHFREQFQGYGRDENYELRITNYEYFVNEIIFWILSAGAIASALLMVTRKSAVPSALLLVLTFCFLAGLYLTLNAQFLAVVQVAVYAGAIMVLVVFVIMLLNLRGEIYSLTGNW